MSSSTARWIAPLVAAVVLLSGCAHVRVPEDDGFSFEERRMRLQAVSSWDMRGRLAIDTGERALSLSFQWQQRGESISLLVRHRLGGTVLQVTGSPDELVVRAEGETWTLGDPESELSAMLGWWMPVGSLHAWLLGLPDQAFEARTRLGPNQTLATMEQRFWQINYATYQLSEGLLVPRRIDMSHGETELWVNVDTWTPTSSLTSALNSRAAGQHNTRAPEPTWGSVGD